MKIKKYIKLAGYTTFHVGGRAEFFAEIKNLEDLKKAANFAGKKKLKIFILGGGSNVLLPDDGIKGLVVKMNIKGITFENAGESVFVYAGAGEEWDRVVAKAVTRNLGGIENLSLIPGTVGGAVYQNIGAYGTEIKGVVESVDVFNLKNGEIKKILKKGCRFGYRSSIFQKATGRKYIILGVTLKLVSNNYIPNIVYPDLVKRFASALYHDRGMKQMLKNRKIAIARVRNAIIKIRKSKLVYPTKNIGTAGSFFKNPVITATSYRQLALGYPDIMGKDIGDEMIKLFAGQLIEKAGWKGKRVGNAGVSKKHALVLVSYPSCEAGDILKLAKLIQISVKDKFGVTLEPEVGILEARS